MTLVKLAYRTLVLFLALSCSLSAKAQLDTVKHPEKLVHSPKKAATYSAILPGLGQAYNKKWWKIPIVYAAIGTSTGFIVYNHRKYQTFKQAYIDRLNNPSEINEYSGYSTDNLFDIQDTYHNWRDISIIVTGAFYVLNIVDATVDAHFFRYDISDNLSLHFQPHLNFVKPGLSVTLKFK